MNTEDRLEILIRACVDDDVRDLALPPGLAARVTAEPRRPRRRLLRGRIHFFTGLAVVSTAAALVAVPALVDDGPARVGPAAVSTPAPTPFDPTAQVKIAYLPPGWREEIRPGETHPGLDEVPQPPGRARHVREWSANYMARSTAPGWKSPAYLRVLVRTGRVDLEAERRLAHQTVGSSRYRPIEVSVGRAVQVAEPAPYTTEIVIWEPRPGLLLTIRGIGVSTDVVHQVLKGIVVA